jgi:hypothetical protein
VVLRERLEGVYSDPRFAFYLCQIVFNSAVKARPVNFRRSTNAKRPYALTLGSLTCPLPYMSRIIWCTSSSDNLPLLSRSYISNVNMSGKDTA